MGNKVDVFVDESGIGRKVGFSVYCLTICSIKDKQLTDSSILEIEKALKIGVFHWREQSWNIKIKFLKEITKWDFWTSAVCIIDNKLHPYQTPEEVISKALFGLQIDTIYIDGKKTKKYTFAVKKGLKSLGLKVSKLKMVSSSACGALRISDTVAGIVRLSLEGKFSEEVLAIFNKVNKKITTQILSGHLPNPPHGR